MTRNNKPKKATITTTADIQIRVTMEARSQNELMRIIGYGAHAKLVPAGDGLYRVVAEHPGAKIKEIHPL